MQLHLSIVYTVYFLTENIIKYDKKHSDVVLLDDNHSDHGDKKYTKPWSEEWKQGHGGEESGNYEVYWSYFEYL